MSMENCEAVEVGPGGVQKGAKTSDYYRISDMPDRFDNPELNLSNAGNPVFTCPDGVTGSDQNSDWFQGYKAPPQHPMYRTSNSDYGCRNPSVHTMPTKFFARTQKFSGDLGKCSMYRNHSLNTASDKSFVPDH